MKTKKLVICALLSLTLIVNMNRSAFADYPNSGEWTLSHAYASDLVDELYLVIYGNGYYAKITSKGGNDPYNTVTISCPNNNVSGVNLSELNSDLLITPGYNYDFDYVEFDIFLNYTNSLSYHSSNNGSVRIKL